MGETMDVFGKRLLLLVWFVTAISETADSTAVQERHTSIVRAASW
jgi:hypothetical protein